MINRSDIDRDVRRVKAAARRAGLAGAEALELRYGGQSAWVPHALLGPREGQVTYAGANLNLVDRFLEGMCTAFEMLSAERELMARRSTPEEAAVLDAEIDSYVVVPSTASLAVPYDAMQVVRLGDHFEADEA